MRPRELTESSELHTIGAAIVKPVTPPRQWTDRPKPFLLEGLTPETMRSIEARQVGISSLMGANLALADETQRLRHRLLTTPRYSWGELQCHRSRVSSLRVPCDVTSGVFDRQVGSPGWSRTSDFLINSPFGRA
jgi:hypothetical protein